MVRVKSRLQEHPGGQFQVLLAAPWDVPSKHVGVCGAEHPLAARHPAACRRNPALEAVPNPPTSTGVVCAGILQGQSGCASHSLRVLEWIQTGSLWESALQG